MSDELIEAVASTLCAEEWGGELSDMSARSQAKFRDFARSVLSAIEAAGFAIVPKEPTDEMLAEADSSIPRFEPDVETGIRMMGVDGAKLAWDAMLSARPKVTT